VGVEYAMGYADAQVRAMRVRREVAAMAPDGTAFMVASPNTSARMWRIVTDAVVKEFERLAAGQVPGTATVLALASGMERAILWLRETLIEQRMPLDVSVGIAMPAGDSIHIAMCAGVRMYRARGNAPERVPSPTSSPEGLLNGPLVVTTEALHAGEVFVLGTREAFSIRAVGNLAQTLNRPGPRSVVELCDGVLDPCRSTGQGAAAVVIRRT